MTLTPQQKIGQRFIIRIDFDDRGALDLETHLETVKRFQPGGIITFGGQASTFKDSIDILQAASEIPLLVTSDFERGAGQQVAGATEFPHLMALGSIADDELTRRVATATAAEASALGVHLLFAPVLDINSNPRNPIINTRAFGDSANSVADSGETFIRALSAGGVAACAKHFPGHGNTDADSHISLPAVAESLEQLETRELIPFRRAVKAGVPAIMVGHMWVRCMDPEPCPASLSHRVTSELLRDTLGYQGVSVSDALVMDAITGRYSPDDAVLKALSAGIDLVLMPLDPGAAVNAAGAALESGNLDQGSFEDSVQRILELKKQTNAFGSKSGFEVSRSVAFSKSNRQLADLVAERSISILSGNPGRNYHASELITITGERGSLDTFVHHFTTAFGSKEIAIRLSAGGSISGIGEKRTEARHLVIASNIQPAAGQGFISFPEPVIGYLSEMSAGREVTFFSFGSPYLHHQIRADHVICCFSDVQASQRAVVKKLVGG